MYKKNITRKNYKEISEQEKVIWRCIYTKTFWQILWNKENIIFSTKITYILPETL